MPSALTSFGPRLILGAVLLISLLAANIVLRHRSTRTLYETATLVSHTHAVMGALDRVLTSVVDAETGERGYLITGDERYLEPYRASEAQLAGDVESVAALIADNPAQIAALAALRDKLALKQGQLRETIEVFQRSGREAARALVLTGRSKAAMDDIRAQIRGMQAREQRLLDQRARQADEEYRTATVTGIASGTLGLLMTLAFVWSVRRNAQLHARASAELHREREHLRVTLSSIGDGVIVTNPAGQIETLNGVAEKLTGWTTADAVGQPLESVFRIVNEDTRHTVENPVARALRDGIIVGLANHTVLIAKDGTERPIADSAAPIRAADHAVLGAVLVFRDVSDDRRSELALNHALAREQTWAERLRQVANASLTINAATTKDSIVGVIDGEARRILGAGRCSVVFDETPAAEDDGSLIVPLLGRTGTGLGYIRCSDKSGGRFDDDDRAVLTQMAQMASIALENSLL